MRILNLHIASKQEDRTHNYGHGKVATLCTGAGAVVLLLAGFQVLSLGAGELIILTRGQDPVAPGMSALFVAAISFLSKGNFFHFNGKRPLRFSEDGNSANSPHFRKEIFFSGCVLLGIGCTFLPGEGWIAADSLTAALVSLHILKNSGLLLYGTANELVEASLDEESNRKIRDIINESEGVITCRELKTRKIGNDIAINASISVKDSLNIGEAAGISSRVEERLKAAYGEETYTLIKAEPGPERSCTVRKWNKLPEERAGKNLILEN